MTDVQEILGKFGSLVDELGTAVRESESRYAETFDELGRIFRDKALAEKDLEIHSLKTQIQDLEQQLAAFQT